MQGSKGKRILELVKNAKSEENLEKNRGNYPKIVVHSNIALKGQETIKPIASTSHVSYIFLTRTEINILMLDFVLVE